MDILRRPFLWLLLLLRPMSGTTQDTIYLQNPSFELDPAGLVMTPRGWTYYGTALAALPTIEPGLGSRKKAAGGRKYISLLAYKNGTKELVGQQLPQPLLQDSAYYFSVTLAMAPKFKGPAGRKHKHPLVLRLWGVNTEAGQQEVLAQTVPVDHDFWYQYRFLLTPRKASYPVLVLEAAYNALRGPGFYNGNILVDECSPFIKTTLSK